MTATAAPRFADGAPLTATPVTVGQYWAYLDDTGRRAARHPHLHGFPPEAGYGLRTTSGGAIAIDDDLSSLPVTWVTWHGAVAYAVWLSATTGRRCRLPFAAEWEQAAAGPDGCRWSLGDDFDRETYAPADATGPRPVGAIGPNPFGLYDMTGNVFEWCLDARPHAPSASRVIKGGAYTVRNPESFENMTSFTADELSALPYIGFRVLAEPEDETSE